MNVRNLGLRLAVAAGAVMASVPAFAALDVSGATSSIGDATTASVTVITAMIAVAGVVWGIKRVKKLLGG